MFFPHGARLQDFGRLRRAGDLKVLSPNGEQTDYVFLLDTIMVLCNKPSIMQQRYRFKSAIKLKDYQVEDVRGNSGQNTIRMFPRLNLMSHPLILMATMSAFRATASARADNLDEKTTRSEPGITIIS